MSGFRVLTNQICPWAGWIWCTEGTVISANPFVWLLGLLGHRRGECKAYKGKVTEQLQSAPGYKYAIKPLKVQFQSRLIVAKFIPFWSGGTIFYSYYINSTYFIFTVENFIQCCVRLGLAEYINKWEVVPPPSELVPSQKLKQIINQTIPIYGALRISYMHLFIVLNVSSIDDEAISVLACSRLSCTILYFTTELISNIQYFPLHSFHWYLMSELKTSCLN